jgi:PAS domain S-box-containing protein
MLFYLAGLALTGGYSYYVARRALLNRTFEQLTSIREVKARQIEDFFADRLDETRYLSQEEFLGAFYGFDINNFKTEFGKHSGNVASFLLRGGEYLSIGLLIPGQSYYRWDVDSRGKIYGFSSIEPKRFDAFSKRLDTLSAPALLDTVFYYGKGHWAVPIVSPVKHKNGVPVVLVLEISNQAIDGIMVDNHRETGMGRTGEVYLVGNDYKLRSTSRFRDTHENPIDCSTESIRLGRNGEKGTLKTTDYRGIEVLSAFKRIEVSGLNWVISADMDWDEALNDALRLRRNIIIISLALILLIGAGVLFFSWKITTPLVKLKEATFMVAEGKFDWLLPIKRRDEIGALTQGFNKMTLRLKHTTRRLMERERRLLHFYRATIDGIVIHKAGTPIMVNRAALTMTGYSEEELLKHNPISLFSDDEHLLHRSDPDEIQFFETELIAKDKKRLPVEVQRKRVVFNDQDVEALVIRDISQRRAVENELKEERLHRLRSVIDGQEQERQRLSRELHDGLGQTLVAIKLRMESMHPDRLGEEQRTFEMVKQMFNQTIEETRRISNNLMPAALTEFSLAVVLRNLCNEVESNSGITISLVVGVLPDSLDQMHKTYAYRIAQEALTNIIKHSEATKATVSVFSDILKLYLHIEDNGIGFSASGSLNIGNGLYNMKERASLLGGKLVVISSPGNGTKVKAELPFRQTNKSNKNE